MKKLTTLLTLVLLAFTAGEVLAQSATSSSGHTLTITEYKHFSAATYSGLANLETGLNPANDVLVGTPQTQPIRIETNSATGVNVALAITSGSVVGGTGNAFDDLQVRVTSGGSTTHTAAAAGASAGTFNPINYTASGASGTIISAIKGGDYTWNVNYAIQLNNSYALAGARTFNAAYTFAP